MNSFYAAFLTHLGAFIATHAVTLLVGALCGYVVAPYVRRKVENLADRQDGPGLVDAKESPYLKYHEEQQHQRVSAELRTAALEDRLRAHQEAFAQVNDILLVVHGDSKERYEVLNKCRAWWRSNCLYLEPQARKAFLEAVVAADTHHLYLDEAQGQRDKSGKITDEAIQKIKNNFNKITELGAVIERAVELPPMNRVRGLIDGSRNTVDPFGPNKEI